jgi:NADP-reducing hydrogenase subunit HndD
MENMINLTIDGVQVSVPAGSTVLDAARKANVHIPTLCYLKDVNEIGACRVCVVDVGGRALQAACVYPVSEGMVVKTNTPAVRRARKVVVELLLSIHDRKCLSCPRNNNCELQDLCRDLGIEDDNHFAGEVIEHKIDDASPCVVRDNNKCVLCRRCVSACHKQQNVGVIGAVKRGFGTSIESPWGLQLAQTGCVGCGQCIVACPVGALREKDGIKAVDKLLESGKHVFVQPAPAVRAALGEEFGLPMGTPVTGIMVAALRRLGFEKVFDTDFGADLTILEEATELVQRIQNKGVLPMITSCSPGWVKYCETYNSDFIPNLSSCKSPHEMLGAVIKSYYAEKAGLDPKQMAVVSVMPCTAKKYEARRPELSNNGLPDVDEVITTRELARMIRSAGIDFANLPDEDFDRVLGESTGGAVIFGATGGVMEAALRYAYEAITGQELKQVEFHEVRGLQGVKEAIIDLGSLKLNVAVAHGTANAQKLLDSVRSGEKHYEFIEIMCCPGGCVTGGGQPIVKSSKRAAVNVSAERAKALYSEDEGKPRRKSQENEELKVLYSEYLGEIGGHRAHHLLHTTYTARDPYEQIK